MHALVTGGAGFVGRHLCQALLDAGWHVHCVDPIVPRTGGLMPDAWPLFRPMDNPRFTFEAVDCREVFERNERFDYIFHLAAMVGGRLMIEFDPLAVAEDLSIDAAMFRYAAHTKPAKCVFFSSSAAYPVRLQQKDDFVLLREDMIDFTQDIGVPDLSYGWAKLTGEFLARLAHQRHGLNVICFRPFSGYGEDQDLAYPFPSICRRALENRGAAEISVWGSGDQMRDFIHISDCIAFVLAAMDRVDDGSAVNLSSGVLTSFRKLALMAARAAGYEPVVRGMSEQPEGVFARGGDRTLQDRLGLVPRMSLESGVQRGVAFQARALGLNEPTPL